ncbi:DUF2254 domain-containing protein [Pontibacter ummariensis]|nr:DUF2254 family protein [Pontibacter ummariensis]
MFEQVTTSVAFYPAITALGMLAIAWGVTYLDKISMGKSLLDEAPFLKVEDASTARSLLSSLLTGLISLVTFTFAMIMIVLTQITSSFSPRLLPDLLRKKPNQVVIGIIIGTILFTIVALSNIGTLPAGPKVPLLSTILATFFGVVSLLTFIYFIHRISNEVQIGNILNSIYRAARNVIDTELNSGSYHEKWEEQEEFHVVKSWDSGYFDKITHNEIMSASRKSGLKVRVLKDQGTYLLKGEPFLEINRPLDEKTLQLLQENVLLRHQEMVQENFLYGFKHLTEVAVRGLSPGVNDPGTAIQAINYLMDLLCRLQQLKGQKVVKHRDGTACIIYAPVPFETIFYMCTASIRAYSSKDVTVQTTLVNMISKIKARDEEKKHTCLLKKELASIEEASKQEMKTQEDVDYIQALLQHAREEHQG